MSRDHILHKVRTAVGRSAGDPALDLPPVLLRVPELGMAERIAMFQAALEKLSGKVYVAASAEDAREYAARLTAGKSAVASESPFLAQCGVAALPGVMTGFTDRDRLKEACSRVDIGITSADYALADTGSLVMLSSREEARLVSLLPPEHLAIVPRDRLLTGLDELFSILPDPAAVTSSMVLITGPSRTADIEQILVRGVHGPGAIHVVLV
jgi:L-lactate utilization protein LutC